MKIVSASVRIGKTTIDNKMIECLKENILFFATQMTGLNQMLCLNFTNQ